MSVYYLETSALVKPYVQELGTDRLLRLAARSAGHRFSILVLSRVEFHSAIRRRQREGDVDAQLADRILNQFDQHMQSKFVVLTINDTLIDLATDLVERHALRAYDAVQLAGCLILRANSAGDEPTFVSSDLRLLEAAGTEGLFCLDPNRP